MVGQSRVCRYIHLGKYDVTSHSIVIMLLLDLDTTTEDSAPRTSSGRSISPVVVAVVVGYVAARGRSASPAAKKNKPVPFRKILQGNITQSDNIGKVRIEPSIFM